MIAVRVEPRTAAVRPSTISARRPRAIGWFNAVKRELAVLAASGVVAWVGGGRMFTLEQLWSKMRDGIAVYSGPTAATGERSQTARSA